MASARASQWRSSFAASARLPSVPSRRTRIGWPSKRVRELEVLLLRPG